MLSEQSQTQKTPYGMIPFIWNVQSREIDRDKTQTGAWPGLGEGRAWGAAT